MRKILIEAEKLNRPFLQGTQRYVRGLLSSLARVSGGEDWKFHVLTGGGISPLEDALAREARLERAYQGSARRTLAKKLADRAEGVPGVARVRRGLGRRRIVRRARRLWEVVEEYDLVHLTSPHSYRSLTGCQIPFVGTVLDLTHRVVPQYHLDQTIDATESGLHFIADRAVGVIAISGSTRDDFLSEYGYQAERTHVVHAGVDREKFAPAEDSMADSGVIESYGIRSPYLLALSTVEPRKNIEGVLLAWRQIQRQHPDFGVQLVIAGRTGWKAAGIIGEIRDLQDHGVIATGYVSDDHVAALYRNAIALCYVSHYEGFGLPTVEAMSCGTPVIYGDNSAMAEVVGSAGLGADSYDIENIASRMLEIVEDRSLRGQLSRRATQRAADFGWDLTARGTLDVYRRYA